MKEWVFYSIYVPRAEYLEKIIVNIVTPAVQQIKNSVQVHKWFFIRYIDMQGPHIRLRFLVDEAEMEAAEELLEERFSQCLSAVIAEPVPDLSRLLPIKAETADFESGFQQEEYEQEYEKYGGLQGVDVAENIFQSSSELALLFVNHDYFSDKDRFDLALLLMKITAEKASLSEAETRQLWESMLHYWSGADYTEGISYKTKLEEAAKKRVDVINQVMERMAADPRVKELTDGYGQVLEHAFSEIKESEKIRTPVSHLAFHYIHMMNNRLGVWPIEEAYLGALLAHTSGYVPEAKS
ncbi:thiopeptide-type bacteriocin biosynthesis protein [Bacillus atrophaeus]|uniref:thiopeptide-type bacteriocin biosynthesis protein n=1 Tax=Bacillus atrophaeus TaxID=1452 RepID=UPI00228009ED|nr:thiopeptide-type bacteriocin biosynthesis protein [Bacillus atrophaeus]MCY8960573.1 thiopeptide-type bacteriocin biosynthesis protein [Bacillus atrophaeus]MCY8962264.1 thiopeptide-type bacteriocin biosynthesis protein [Bacillus atrophaeus]MCY8972912.1 thiopeptide-type bacteriocin biosynthesis protein [Bacillus atrophaeus]MCY9134375.1 thiopeptide-type bacteriocin biosynthesis protein [Bacillus atrophaeus]MCY9438931.1 thiopeptide-type bacteriocin biosynthesis protein [Bacillus atrophaeus]